MEVLKSKRKPEEHVQVVCIKLDQTEKQRKYLKQVLADFEKQKG